MFAHVEMTDTFGGEANYCWVKRANFPCDGLTDRQIVMRAKKAMDYSGYRTVTKNYGDGFRLDFAGMNIVLFISFSEDESDA